MITVLIAMTILAAATAIGISVQLANLKKRMRAIERGTETESALKQASECMSCLHEGMIVVSREGLIVECNPAAEQILGSPAMELKGQSAREFYALPSACDELSGIAEEEGRLQERPALMKGTSGKKKLVHVSMSPVAADGEGRMVQVFRDCADLRSMEARLVQSERLATIGKFASQIAHEVRNPLSSISLNLEMLDDEFNDSDGDARNLIRSVLRELDRLNGIVGEYLQFARFPKPHPRKGQIEEVIAELSDSFTAPDGVKLVKELAVPSPEIWFDGRLIRQALDNLVRNAAEAFDGDGEIRIETDLIDRFLLIRVRDNGRGIPQEVQSKLFDPFFTTKANGTGLGLATTQQIVFEHNGHIQVESQPGKGSTFSIYLPL